MNITISGEQIVTIIGIICSATVCIVVIRYLFTRE